MALTDGGAQRHRWELRHERLEEAMSVSGFIPREKDVEVDPLF
jgi:hypothetical protein